MKPISELLPKESFKHWGRGCDQCKCGVLSAPDIVAALPFYESRAGQAAEGMITFCNCRAGHMYRQHLRKLHNSFSMEQQRNILAHVNAAATPTVHFERAGGEPV